jgi:RNA polymerase sigma-70 factor, ECF subfamily
VTVGACTVAGMTPRRPPAEIPPDDELVARLRGRDESAFALLVDAWSPGMIRVARSIVSTDASAAEVVQDAWLAVVSGIGGFEGRSALRTWVYRIVVNTAVRRSRREGRSVPISSLPAGGPEAEDAGPTTGPTVDPARFRGAGEPWAGHWREFPASWPSPESAALDAEVRRTVACAIDRLPERQRLVISLRDVDGCTAEEVCAIMDLTGANQRVLLHRARAFVRAELEAYFATVRDDEEAG